MKKKVIIAISIVLILIVAIAVVTYFIIQKTEKEKRNYEIVQVNIYNYFVIKEQNKYGVIDRQGNKIIEPIYDNIKIPNPEQAIFVCYEAENTKVLNEKSEQILIEFEDVEPLRLKNVSSDLVYEKSVLKYMENDKYGIIDFNGKKLTNAIYDDIETLKFKEGELLVKIDGKYGVININGAILVKPEYDKIESDGYYNENNGYKNSGYIVSTTTEEGYRFGYVNLNGKEIVEAKYNQLYRIDGINSEKIYLICAENGKYGLLNNGDKIIENEYQSLNFNENNNTIIALKGKRYGAFSIDGKNIIPFEYKQIDTTGDYLYTTDLEDNVKVYDKNGNVADISENLKILNTENENYKIYINSENEKTLYSIYKNEKQQTKQEYTYLQYLFDDYFIASNIEGKLGIINDEEKNILDFKYNSIQKIESTDLIEAINNETNTMEIYSNKMNKLYELENSSIEFIEEYIKLYNETSTIYIARNGEEITNIEAVLKKPTIIGIYKQVVYGNGEIYYTRK